MHEASAYVSTHNRARRLKEEKTSAHTRASLEIPMQRRGFPGISFHFVVCRTALNSSHLAYCIVGVYLHNNQREAVKNLCREKTCLLGSKVTTNVLCECLKSRREFSARNTSRSAANRETRLLNKIPFNLLSNLLRYSVSYFISL